MPPIAVAPSAGPFAFELAGLSEGDGVTTVADAVLAASRGAGGAASLAGLLHAARPNARVIARAEGPTDRPALGASLGRQANIQGFCFTKRILHL